jgi:hypothetical protein
MSSVELQRKPFNPLPQEELTKQQQLHIDALSNVDPLVVSEAEYQLAAQVSIYISSSYTELIW